MSTYSLQSSCDAVLKVTCNAWGAVLPASEPVSVNIAGNNAGLTDTKRRNTLGRDTPGHQLDAVVIA